MAPLHAQDPADAERMKDIPHDQPEHSSRRSDRFPERAGCEERKRVRTMATPVKRMRPGLRCMAYPVPILGLLELPTVSRHILHQSVKPTSS